MKACPILLLPLLFSIVGGCSRNASVEVRRKFAIEYNQQDLRAGTLGKNEVRVQSDRDILAVLTSVSAEAVAGPRTASATVGKGKNGQYGLIVYWLERYPSVDGLELQIKEREPSIIVIIPEPELKQNQSAAKETIVFGAEYTWDENSEQWKSLEQISSVKDLKVRLLRARSAITEWFPVRLYKVDHWVNE